MSKIVDIGAGAKPNLVIEHHFLVSFYATLNLKAYYGYKVPSRYNDYSVGGILFCAGSKHSSSTLSNALFSKAAATRSLSFSCLLTVHGVRKK